MTTEERLARLENGLRNAQTDISGILKVAYALTETAKDHLSPQAKATLIERLKLTIYGEENEAAQSFAAELLQFLRS